MATKMAENWNTPFWREAEGTGLVQPRVERAPEGCNSNFPSCKRGQSAISTAALPHTYKSEQTQNKLSKLLEWTEDVNSYFQ